MRIPFRQQPTTPHVTVEHFRTAAGCAGFTLDDKQLRAAEALAGSDEWIYLAGPPGRGKSWLMDTYTRALPEPSRLRRHWHEFTRDLHREIAACGGIDPALTALLGNHQVFCFDEFAVADRADGIFVDRFLRAAHAIGTRLVLTSNSLPSAQMPNPRLHVLFQTTIDFLETHCQVIELDSPTDYRSLAAARSGFGSGQWIVEVPGIDDGPQTPLDINGRMLTARAAADGHLVVDFAEICGRALGATDYLALAQRHRTWTIVGVPDLADAGTEPAQRFLNLIDVLYDQDVATTLVAVVDKADFGRRGRVPASTPRLLSRLQELQTGQRGRMPSSTTERYWSAMASTVSEPPGRYQRTATHTVSRRKR